MQESTVSFLIKFIVGVAIWISTNIYFGAFAIAFISAFTRIVYEAECRNGPASCSKKFFRYFILSLGLAMLFVHVGLINKWSQDTTIVVSAVFAFMSEETFRFIMKNWELVLVRLSNKVGK